LKLGKNNNITSNTFIVDNLRIKTFLCAREADFMIEGGNHLSEKELTNKLKRNFN